MNFRAISSWAIRNPMPPIVLFIALTLLGLAAFMRMSITANPDISAPYVYVSIAQPGAAPPEIESQITQRVEAALRSVNGVDMISSRIMEGQSGTFVQFNLGVPVDRAVNDVRDAVANIRGDLPDGILEPQIQRMDMDGGPIAIYSVSADDMTVEQLSWFVDNSVAKQLLAVPGMSTVNRNGGVSREIRVILDPLKLQQQGVSASFVNQQLRQQNVNAAGGRAEIAGSEQSVRVLGNAGSAHQLGQLRLTRPDGSSFLLSDVARVVDMHDEPRSLAKMDGKPVVGMAIVKAKGESDVSVFEGVKEKLAQIEKNNPGVKFTLLYTTVNDTLHDYKGAMSAMIEGAVLAVVVVFLFLRDWRATVISSIAIPLSAIPTFWFMSLMGFNLNGITLLALSLVAGVLVDDAIVEIENIVRHMKMGKSPYQAAMEAADEIGLAVVATTMAIVAVFLPVALMPGITGQFFKAFGLTIVVSVLMSLAVARLITPLLAAYFLKPTPHREHDGPMMRAYLTALAWTLRHRWVAVVVSLVAMGLTVLSFSALQFIAFPANDQDYSRVKIEMVPGTTLAQTEATTDAAANLLRASPVVQSVYSAIDVGSSEISLTLRPDRKMTSVEFERAMATRLAAIPDARISFESQNSGIGRDVSIMLSGSDPVLLSQTAQKLVQQMNALPQLRAARIDGDLQRPELIIRPRRALAAELGVTSAAISQTIRIATQGEIDQNAAKFSLSDRQVPIRVALDPDSRRQLSTIANLPVAMANGGSVPLKIVADISFGEGPTVIRRYNQNRRIAIGADLAPGYKTASEEINKLPILKNLPQGVERVSFGGDKEEAEMMKNFVFAIVAGMLLLFAVLLLLYRRAIPPFVNMGSLLLAPLGGAIALYLTDNPISMAVMIGILMLLGIVAKNSILLIDFALEEMDKGVPTFEAIFAAGHKRAQPIVMTTVAMVAGMVPVVANLDGGSGWRVPMGVVVIGGLILSTALTLILVPALFSLAIGLEKRIAPRLRRLLTNGGDDAPAYPLPPMTGEDGVRPAE